MIVVSPLILLMQDQGMTNLSTIYTGGADNILKSQKCARNYQFVYCSPESLLTENCWCDMLQSPIYRKRLVGIGKDECHWVNT